MVCGLSTMIGIIEGSRIEYMLPYFRCEMKSSFSEQLVLRSVGYIGILLGLPMWGILADTWGRKEVMLTSIAVTYLCSFLAAFSIDMNCLILARFIGGLLYVHKIFAIYSHKKTYL